MQWPHAYAAHMAKRVELCVPLLYRRLARVWAGKGRNAVGAEMLDGIVRERLQFLLTRNHWKIKQQEIVPVGARVVPLPGVPSRSLLCGGGVHNFRPFLGGGHLH